MSHKILIIGADGQLAFDLIRVLKRDYQVIKARHNDLDICNKISCEQVIKRHKPAIVINTAAYHKTEECELNPERSFQVNTIGAFNVAKAAAAISARVMFISTDYVFDGKKRYFTEDDAPNPINVYGASKLAGENLTKIANDNYYIIRTSGIFGIHRSGKGHNFVSLMIEKAKHGEEIRVVDDIFSSLTYAYDLASKMKELMDVGAPTGIYHIVNSGFGSWYEFARKIFKTGQVKAKLLRTNSLHWSSNLKRPKYGCLKSKNLGKIGVKALRPWEEALGDYLSKVGRVN